MISDVDKLLLNRGQQVELERAKRSYLAASAAGDQAGMQAAHKQAESIRAAAGYSGGVDGSRYLLLQTNSTPAALNGYGKLVQQSADAAMQAVAAGYAAETQALEKEQATLKEKLRQDSAAARSAVWDARRMASEGLLTRGMERTGVAQAITAAALNEASSNAYRALLDREQALADQKSKEAEAKATALDRAAAIQSDAGTQLGKAYLELLNREDEQQADMAQLERDYYYKLLLQQMKLAAQ